MKPGDKIGSWIVDERLGGGGMGSVYKAQNQHAPSIMSALKVLDRTSDPRSAKRFRREAEVLFRMDHPSIVRIKDFHVVDGESLLVMDFVDGLPLHKVRNAGTLDQAATISIGAQLASALAHAHEQQVFHRDVKPANCVVRKDGAIILVDFGIALDMQQSRMTLQSKLSPATYYYAPPEWMTSRNVDPHGWDVYSLGLVLVETLTMKRAFKTQPASSGIAGVQALFETKKRAPGLDPGPGFLSELRQLLVDMTQPKVSDRVTSMSVVRDRFAQLALEQTDSVLLTAGGRDTLALARKVLKQRIDTVFDDEQATTGEVSVSNSSRVGKAPRVVGAATVAKVGEASSPADKARLEQQTKKLGERITQATGQFRTLDVPVVPQDPVSRAFSDGAYVVTALGEEGRRSADEHLEARQLDLAPTLELGTIGSPAVLISTLAQALRKPSADEAECLARLQRRGAVTVYLTAPADPELGALVRRLSHGAPKARFIIHADGPLGIPGEVLVGASTATATDLGQDALTDDAECLERLAALGEHAKPAFAATALFGGPATSLQLTRIPGLEVREITLEFLVGAGLLERSAGRDGAPRYAPAEGLRPAAERQLRAGPKHGPRQQAADQGLVDRIFARDLDRLRFAGPVSDVVWLLDERESLRAALERRARAGDDEQTARLATALAVVLWVDAGARAVVDAVAEHLPIAAQPAWSSRLHCILSAAQLAMGRTEEAAALADAAGRKAWEARERPMVAVAMAEQARAILHQGKAEEAEQMARAALELLGDSHSPLEAAWVWTIIAAAHGQDGSRPMERQALERALALLEGSDALRLEARVHLALARTWAKSRDIERADLHLRAASQLAEGVHSVALEGEAAAVRAGLLMGRGRLDEARDAMALALDCHREAGERVEEAARLSDLGLLERLTGQREAAAEHLEEALKVYREIDDKVGEAVVLGNLGDLLLERGRCVEARAHLGPAVDRLDAAGMEILAAAFLGPLGECEARLGQFGTAVWQLDRAEHVLREARASDLLVVLLCHRGQVELLAGQATAARSSLLEARALLSALGHAPASELGQRVAGLATAIVSPADGG